ncbi:3-dehydro-L-gulonate 2-dehydrogenase [Lacrimispora sp.]|uniref:3-dehydro-L-gulonate 2-dehydrogenase n=1 Tax=Lacrimispora sp. TaxID=2719234 RepID=UPI0028A79777|nr:3-dehydro-L-gulonate 2-dehydrogenase [Lacrimispora sp.]
MGVIRIPFDEVRLHLKNVLLAYGCPEDKADKTAHEMTRNSLEGVYTHGINRFVRLVRNIEDGILKPEQNPVIVSGSGAIMRVDGQLGLGVPNAWFCMGEAIRLAGQYGIGLVALKNTNHWMRAATYGYQACDAGMAAVCFTNTIPNMPTWGAVDSRIGNNPLVLAFPRKGGHLITDMAMSQFSYGALELARLRGRQMEIDAGFDMDGNLTKDPDSVIRSQRILPTGYWKGAALSFMLDIFAGALSEGNTVSGVGKLEGDEHGVSQVFLAIDYKKMVPEETAASIVEQAVLDLLASKKAEGTRRIIYTGELAEEYREENSRNGIPVDERVWEEIMALKA